MKDDIFVPIFIAIIFVSIILLMLGNKIGMSNAYDNCIDYYKESPVVEARMMCRKIVIEGKR